MLLAERRIALMHVSLAGMETLWFAPLFLIFWRDDALGLLRCWLWLFGGALFWMLALDAIGWLLGETRLYGWSIAGLLVLSTLTLVQSIVYPAALLGDFQWLLATLRNLPVLRGGLRPEAVLLWTNVALWLRAGWSSRRNLSTLGVEGSFKFSFLLLLLTTGVWYSIARRPVPLIYAPLYLGMGWVGLTIARSDERAALAATEGRRLPLGRLAQFLVMVVGFVIGAALLGRYLPARATPVFNWLLLAFQVGFALFQLAVVAMMILGAQLGQWLGAKLGFEMAETGASAPSIEQVIGELLRRSEETPGRDIVLSPAVVTALRYAPALVLLVLLGVIFLLVVRRARRRARRIEREDENRTPPTPGGWLRRAAAQLRDVAGMAKRFGVSYKLLAAISVQNIYANVGRMAARQGHPRPAAMPPDVYLSILQDVFTGCDEALTRITLAYMQVHYGDRPVSARDLARLQADYQAIRTARSE